MQVGQIPRLQTNSRLRLRIHHIRFGGYANADENSFQNANKVFTIKIVLIIVYVQSSLLLSLALHPSPFQLKDPVNRVDDRPLLRGKEVQITTTACRGPRNPTATAPSPAAPCATRRFSGPPPSPPTRQRRGSRLPPRHPGTPHPQHLHPPT